jgi:hypothetical protein
LLEANVRGRLFAGVLREHVTAHSRKSLQGAEFVGVEPVDTRVELLAPDLAVLAGTEEVESVVALFCTILVVPSQYLLFNSTLLPVKVA